MAVSLSCKPCVLQTNSMTPVFVQPGYCPHCADNAVRFPHLLLDGRFWELLYVFVSLVLLVVWQSLLPAQNINLRERRRRQAEQLKGVFVSLGPTFIKVGQFLAVRRDLLPAELADELATLQDQVPPFCSELVRQVILEQLGQAPEVLFANFEPIPLAAASIGQVHRVRLHNGRRAVVKVQRPGLVQIFYRDLGYLRLWARMCQLIRHNCSKGTWIELADELGRTLFGEIDYIQEGRNADRLRSILRQDVHVKVPRVHWRYTGRKVLTLEYLPGIKIDQVTQLKAQGVDLRSVANLLVRCYLKQIFFHGFFHADPHAGNLAVDKNGHLIIYDFGMVGEISSAQRASLVGLARSVVNQELALVVLQLRQLGIVGQETSLQSLTKVFEPFMQYYAGKSLLDLDCSS
ncbi:MAG: AarF/ABC1/UbiB kinase family protein, partial [Candidatus Melainabacteria bacterium]|nr:AarF/ABC1/UbiB kinase family protein [Candidatus Melainabacteria bacterium]